VFFNLCKAKSKIAAFDEGEFRPDQVKFIANRLGVTEQDVIGMNRRLGGYASLKALIREDGDSGDCEDSLPDEFTDQETTLLEGEQLDNRRKALAQALSVLNGRERRIVETRRLAEEFGVSGERARQIDVSSVENLQKAMKNRLPRWRVRRTLSVHKTFGPILPWWEKRRWMCRYRYVLRQPNDARGALLAGR
jgi:RNA polymerase sigma-32 factor